MSHVTVTMIGTHEDLDWIYENCTSDSSSESSAEQAFGYDWLSENEYPYEPTKEEVEEFIKKHLGLIPRNIGIGSTFGGEKQSMGKSIRFLRRKIKRFNIFSKGVLTKMKSLTYVHGRIG